MLTAANSRHDRLSPVVHDHVRAPRLLPPIVAMFAGTLGLALALWGSGLLASLGILILFVVTGMIVLRVERKRWGGVSMVSPASLYAVFWTVFFGGAGIAAVSASSQDALVGYSARPIIRACLVALLSLWLVLAAYWMTTRGSARTTVGDEARWQVFRVDLPVIVVALAIGWLCRFWLIASGQFGYLSGGASFPGVLSRAIQLGVSLIPLALVTLGLVLWRVDTVIASRRACGLLLVVNIPLLVLTALASGMKAQLVTDLMPLGVAYVAVRRRIPAKAICAVVLYLILIFSGVQTLRSDINTGVLSKSERRGVVAAPVNAVTRVMTGLSTGSPASHVEEFWKSFTSEYGGVSRTLAIILRDTPSAAPFLGVGRLLTAPLFFLPSSALNSDSLNLYTYVNVMYLRSTPTSAATPTQPGELYLSGGWEGLVLGQLAVGVLLAGLWRVTLATAPSDPRRLALYALAAVALTNAGMEWSALSRTLLQVAIVYYPITRLFLRAPRGEYTPTRSPAAPTPS